MIQKVQNLSQDEGTLLSIDRSFIKCSGLLKGSCLGYSSKHISSLILGFILLQVPLPVHLDVLRVMTTDSKTGLMSKTREEKRQRDTRFKPRMMTKMMMGVKIDVDPSQATSTKSQSVNE